MQSILPQLQNYITESIFPRYRAFDKGHDEQHVQEVLRESLLIAVDYDVDLNMVYTIAAYHDVGLCFGRKDHHLTSGVFLMEDEQLCQWFDESKRITMQQAVEDHRASNLHAPRSIYGCIVSEADRCLDADTVLRRCVEYQKAHCPEYSPEERFALVVAHLHEKYGEQGYLKLWLDTERNGNGLRQVRAWLKDEAQLKTECLRVANGML